MRLGRLWRPRRARSRLQPLSQERPTAFLEKLKTALVTQSGFNCFHEGLVELSLVLTGSFGLLLPLQAGADVMLALLNLSDHAFLGTAALKTTQSALQRLVLLDANFRHCFPSLRWHPARSRMLSGPYRLDTL